MKRLIRSFALFFALVSAWILFLPFDVPFFIDEMIALPIFIASMKALGIDVTRWISVLRRGKKSIVPRSMKSQSAEDITIDV
jgi:uncharacterized membrane protein (DUF2068 family)